MNNFRLIINCYNGDLLKTMLISKTFNKLVLQSKRVKEVAFVDENNKEVLNFVRYLCYYYYWKNIYYKWTFYIRRFLYVYGKYNEI